jgi:hypothetical protein
MQHEKITAQQTDFEEVIRSEHQDGIGTPFDFK